MLGGISTSQVSGDQLAGFDKVGIVLGGFTRWDFTEKTAFQSELEFIQKGSRRNADPNKGQYGWYLLRLDYVEMYFLFKYTFKKILFEAGPSAGILVRQHEEGSGVSLSTSFNSNDICLNGGIGYLISDNLRFNARYGETFFMTPIRKKENGASTFFIRGQYNTALSFTLQYQFGNHE
jgi:hypothetical protein